MNGVSQGNYFLLKSHKLAVFEAKTGYKNSSGSQMYKLQKIWDVAFCHRCRKKNFSPFCLASPEITRVKVCNRWTARQSNSLTPCIERKLFLFLVQLMNHLDQLCCVRMLELSKQGYVDFVFQLNLLPPYSLSSQGDKENH